MTRGVCFLENYNPQTAPMVRTMELSNFRVNSREQGKWVSATSATMEQNYDWPGSYTYGSSKSCFWALTSGIPGLWPTPVQEQRFYVSEVEAGSPYKV